MGKEEEAFDFIEKMKAQGLLEILEQGNIEYDKLKINVSKNTIIASLYCVIILFNIPSFSCIIFSFC